CRPRHNVFISLCHCCGSSFPISTMPFLLWHFSPGDKSENCSAQFLAVCWIVHVEFKLHRFRHGFSVSNACCSANRFQRSSAITPIRLETEWFSKEAICSSLFRCSSRTVRLFSVCSGCFWILSFAPKSRFLSRSRRQESKTAKML